MGRKLPSTDQIRQLPLVLKKTIPPEYEDVNGHVNIQYYLRLHDEAAWMFFEPLGISHDYVARTRNGIFDLEQHSHYRSEIMVGDVVGIYARTLDVSTKRVHGVWFIVNESKDRLSNVLEFVTTHVDLETRRTSPWPAGVAEKLGELAADGGKLEWPAPVCGVMRA